MIGKVYPVKGQPKPDSHLHAYSRLKVSRSRIRLATAANLTGVREDPSWCSERKQGSNCYGWSYHS